MATPNSTESSGSSNGQDLSQKSSLDEREEIKALLREARETKAVLEDFEAAVKSGSFEGSRMIALAKGMSFIAAIVNQTKAHVFNLQSRLENPDKPKLNDLSTGGHA